MSKQQFRMTGEQLEKILDACKPTVAIWGSGGAPLGPTPQENANNAWKVLGAEMGFVWDSCEPALTGDWRDFLATPLLSAIAKAEGRAL